LLARAHHLATDRWGDEEKALPRSPTVELRVTLKCKSSGHPHGRGAYWLTPTPNAQPRTRKIFVVSTKLFM